MDKIDADILDCETHQVTQATYSFDESSMNGRVISLMKINENGTQEPTYYIPSNSIAAVTSFTLVDNGVSKHAMLMVWSKNDSNRNLSCIVLLAALSQKDMIVRKLRILVDKFKDKDGYEVELQSSSAFRALVKSQPLITKERLSYYIHCVKNSVIRVSSQSFSVEVIGEYLIRLKMTGAAEEYGTVTRRARDVADELLNRRPLPSLPFTPPTPPPRRPLEFPSCGNPPLTLDECPFFLEEVKRIKEGMRTFHRPTLERKKTVYDKNLIPDLPVNTAVIRHKNEILAQEPSNRLSAFLRDVCQNDSDYQALIRKRNVEVTDDYQTDAIYDIPSLNPAKPSALTASVENTLYLIMDRMHKTQWKPFTQSRDDMCFVERCPFGMSQTERCKFCLRLEYLEHDQEMDWKIFAECVMDISNDDLTLIDEFGARHAVPPVEIVLEHWYNLSQVDRSKCKENADKRSIVKVLKDHHKVQLIREMGWEVRF